MPRPFLHACDRRPASLAFFILLLAPVLSAGRASADWPNASNVNLPVCTAWNLQNNCVMAPSGGGCAIIAWQDVRNGVDADVYAQRVLASGIVDPAWPANGRAVCAFSGAQFNPRIVPDGANGVIVVWQDMRSGTDSDVYAQHLLANGALDPAWPASGLSVCTAAGNQWPASRGVAADGTGGALVAWMHADVDTTVYVQHVLADGQLDPAWPAAGRGLGAVADYRKTAVTVSDGAGGAIVIWPDHRGGSKFDLYAQHVLPNGSLDPVWPAGGLAVCGATENQDAPDAIGDGAGGVIVAWQDLRAGNLDVFAQRVLANGTVDPAWPADGRAVCDVLGTQQVPRIVTDGSGGAIIVWQDLRLAADQDLYAQHVLSSGGLDPGWAPTGQVICNAAGYQGNQSPVSDGYGGAIIVWDDARVGMGNLDAYSQHLLTMGGLDSAWPINGRCLSNATGSQNAPNAIADGSGGATVAWSDSRTFASTMNDIYAQRVQANGQLGGVVVDVPASVALDFSLDPVHPNPSRGGPLSVSFALPSEANASVELIDLAGRRRARRDLGTLGPGPHSVELHIAGKIPAGVLFVRVLAGSDSRSVKVAILD